MQHPRYELLRIPLLRLYEKSSNTGEPPRHEANHGSIYQRFAARTQPFVVLAHPPLLVDPSERTLHHPPPRQHHEAFGGHQFAPLYLRPRPQYLFGGWLFRTLHEIHAPAQGLLDPVRALVLSTVARIEPQMREARKSLVRPPKQRLDPFVIHHLGAVDLRFQDQTLSVHQDVAFSALHLLASVVTALFSAHRGALYRLGIHHARAGLRISLQAHPKTFSESSVDPLPGTIDAPFPEVPVNGGPPGEVMRQQAPLAAALEEVEDGVQNLAKTVGSGASVCFGDGHVGFYVFPFGVG